jgi:UDP-N-acetylmuramoyl-L-alanyl-D-glutamate--2,6-diaminopimelate ligase
VGGLEAGHSRSKPFSSLVKSVPEVRAAGDLEVLVSGLAYDSRHVQPGWGFICVPGAKTDGHRFIPEALEKGAVALVVEAGREAGVEPPKGGALAIVPDSRAAMAIVARAFYDDPSSQLYLAGVTGTNGKTTTALVMDSIFRAAGHESGLIGTLEYRIGEQRLKPLHTTPEAVDLQRLLAALVAGGATHAAMEVSSHALSLHRVDGCQFAAAVFTNLTPEHLDFHADMEEYLQAKMRLFTDPQYLPHRGRRVNAINVDDEAGQAIARQSLGRPLTYALEAEASYRAEEIELGPAETRFVVRLPGGKAAVRTRLVGRFNVYNALAAFTACIGLGIPAEVACRALEDMAPVHGRFERVPASTRTVLVDYAHSPDGLRRALETARQMSLGRVIVVFGCGGDRDRTKRPVMGELASRLADRCVVTSDNPRGEDPQSIIEQIVAGIPADRRVACSAEPDRAEAIRIAIEEAGSDDLVLIAGKGHEDYQIFADRTIHFDDREVAEAVLREIEGDADA